MIANLRRAGLAAGLALATHASAPAALAADQVPGYYRFTAGGLTVTAIYDGYFGRPLEGFVRDVNVADVAAQAESEALPGDQYVSYYTTLVVELGDRLVLIDTGNGDARPPTTGFWMQNFNAAGYKAADVDAVVISHFHSDHINGLRYKATGAATFPNATIYVPRPEYDFWMSDEVKNRMPEGMRPMFDGVKRVFGPFGDSVVKFEPGDEVLPGIASIPAYGHTVGHTVFRIGSGDGALLYLADIMANPLIFAPHPSWGIVFETDSKTAEATRRELLDAAARDGTLVAFAHAPFPAVGHIVARDGGYHWVPAIYDPMP
jgi:glyoxylase-like metal-dependent hydrolase (beta-lactamase superfamily II)